MPKKWDVTKAVRASDLPAPARLVMFVLADVAEVGTAEIPERRTPSLAVLAKETGLGKATVTRHLSRLEESGWVLRDRPDEAAMVRGERTRYRLAVPDGVTAAEPAVPEGDQPSPGAGQGLSQSETSHVSERDHPSPTAGHLNKDYRSSTDSADVPPSADAAKPRRPVGRGINAGDVVGAYVDGAKAGGHPRPSERLRKRVGKEATQLLAEKGQDPGMVFDAAFQMGRRGWHDLSVQIQRTSAERNGTRHGSITGPYRNPVDQDDYDDWMQRG